VLTSLLVAGAALLLSPVVLWLAEHAARLR